MGISREQALDCLRSHDLIGMGMEADAVRRRLHPDGVVSYAVGGRVSCGGLDGATGDALEAACEHVGEIVAMGGGGVQLAGWGGRAEGFQLAEVEALVRGVRARFPSVWMEGVLAGELAVAGERDGLALDAAIARLRDAGLDSIADDLPAEGLSGWIAVHRAAHGAGMRTRAVVRIGAGEMGAGLVDALEVVQRLQEETGGFAAVAPRSSGPVGGGTGYGLDEPTAVWCLKALAVARMVLDGIENVEAGGVGRGLKVLQTGLRFGANDAGWVIVDGDHAGGWGEEELRRVIRDAGFRPVERDAAYRVMSLA